MYSLYTSTRYTNMSSCHHAVSNIAGIERLWSTVEYSMSEFIRQHGQRIPVVIYITEGYSGVDELHSVSVEDVRRLFVVF